MTPSSEDNIKRYLLGLLPEEEQEQVERRLLTESDFSEELLLSEEELMELYLAGALLAEERAAFESHFLSTPERQRRVRFAGTLKRYVRARTEEAQDDERLEFRREAKAAWAERWRALWREQRWAVSAAFALLLIAVVGGVWLTRPRAPRTFAPLALSITTGATRGADQLQTAKVRLPLNADALRISLALPEGADRAALHRVELVDAGGETESLKVEGEDAGSVSVLIPAERLRRGRYALRLYETRQGRGEQRIEGSYLFTVE